MLSPLLYILYTHDCLPHNLANLIIKYGDDTPVVGLVLNWNDLAQKNEVFISSGVPLITEVGRLKDKKCTCIKINITISTHFC